MSLEKSLRGLLVAAMAPAVFLVALPGAGAVTNGIVRAPFAAITHETSPNWSGYAAHSGTFDSVAASWVQPAGKCTSKTTYSAFWVGLDGYTSNTVEQTGSEVDCVGGSPQYYAWYEMYPGPSKNYDNTVRPGDQFKASVTASGTSFTLTISDTTEGWSHKTVKSLARAKKSSAEVIAEAPCCTGGGAILPLTDFGKVSFTSATANGSALGSSSPVKINMAPAQGSSNRDTTSSLTGGESFSDAWKAN